MSRKRTKIICTIGPASLSKSVLREMFQHGMDGVRINTAYNDLAHYEVIVGNVRDIAQIPVIVDIKGPSVRINAVKRRRVEKGDRVEIGFCNEDLSFNYDFYDDVAVGDRVLIDNGRIGAKIIRKEGRVLHLMVLNHGVIGDRKGVNVPNKKLSVPPLSEKDMKSIEFAVERDCEYIALSFTRGPEDLKNLRKVAGGFRGAVIAKIENFEGVENYEKILEVADGVMVARGDLGVELEPERVPLLQKWMINLCNNAGKTVITATDILESMIDNPSPTRSEASDVANAILDGTDAIMTSGETAIGRYPVKTVAMISRITKEVEPAVESRVSEAPFINISETVSRSIQRIALVMPLERIVTLTRSGYTARMISRFKLSQRIIAVTPSKLVRNQLKIAYGVKPVCIYYQEEDDKILSVAKILHSQGLIKPEDNVLFTASLRTLETHSSNLIEIHKIDELLKLIKE